MTEWAPTRGHGPKVTDWFLEPTCPHSARAFEKLPALLNAAGEDRLTVRLIMHSQPWHLFSSVVSRAIIAATLLPEGTEAAWKVLASVYLNRQHYVATDHCRGPNIELSPRDILGRIAKHSGTDIEQVFERPEALALLKRQTRFARQNGIHASPTVMVDGLVDDRIGSRDDVADWLESLELA